MVFKAQQLGRNNAKYRKKPLTEDALFFLIHVFQKFKTGVIGCTKIKSVSYQCKEYVISVSYNDYRVTNVLVFAGLP